MICSRYDTVWHVMNVAVDPRTCAAGIATRLLEGLLERIGEPDARLTLEVRPLERAPRSRCTSASASAPPGRAAATTRTTARTR